MTKKILTIALAILALVLAASPALAAKASHRYSPRHGAKCRKTYKRVKRGRKVYCIKQKAKPKKKAASLPGATAPTAPAPPAKTKLHAHLDPTFTRNPLNPFEVTYAYSASASQEAAPQARALGIVEETAPLPSGVLSLFSDGKLECAINVGSGVEGSECPVSYQALGAHSVTTIYTSGEQSATETEVEEISPFPTTTMLRISYSPEPPIEAGIASGLWRVGTLSAEVSAAPAAAHPQIGCGSGASSEQLDPSGCYELGADRSYVFVETSGTCITKAFISKEDGRPGVSGGSLNVTAEGIPVSAIERGEVHLRATVATGAGYGGSEATPLLQFTPEYEGQRAC